MRAVLVLTAAIAALGIAALPTGSVAPSTVPVAHTVGPTHTATLTDRRPPRTRPAFTKTEIECLALNIYHEARGEPADGQLAVAHVVLNRASDDRFPTQICDVVKEGGEARLHRCQFSWWCDGRSDRPRDQAAWQQSRAAAWAALLERTADPSRGALWYHADYVNPVWASSMEQVATIGRHIFYQDRTTATP